MGVRGPKSAAALSVIQGTAAVERVARPNPPAHLSPERQQIWRDVVNAMPADWFRAETHHLLELYTGHIDAGRKLEQLIEQVAAEDPLDVDEYDRLLRMRERESRAASSLATRLRITLQATYDKTKKRTLSHKKLYDPDDED